MQSHQMNEACHKKAVELIKSSPTRTLRIVLGSPVQIHDADGELGKIPVADFNSMSADQILDKLGVTSDE